jgi:GR25 family glycosyltransferase involved in LPS biosynthesis
MLPVKVISLVRSAERRETFRRRNAHLDFDFFDAVDGSRLSLTELHAGGLFEPGLPYSVGAYGVALSHLAQWDQIIESGQARTVAEDDAIFRRDFGEQQARLLQTLPPDWDMVLWGWNFDAALAMDAMPGMAPMALLCDQQQLRGALDTFQSVTAPPHLLRLRSAFGLPCYSMSPAGARKFKAGCFPMRNASVFFPVLGSEVRNFGVDIATNRLYPDLNVLFSLPPLVATGNDHSRSTVQNDIYFPGSPRPS